MKKLIGISIIIIFIVSCAHKETAQTSQRCFPLKSDLNYIHESISHNFSGYAHSLKLRNESDQVFNEEISHAADCSTQVEYMKGLKKYFASFHDPHVKGVWNGLSKYGKLIEISSGKLLSKNQPEFPFTATGIYLQKMGHGFYVKNVDPELLPQTSIQMGDELVNCDDKTPDEILKNEILPYETVSAYEAAEYRFTPNLFFRWDKPNGSQTLCTFKHKGMSYETHLDWKLVGENYLEAKFQPHSDAIYSLQKIPGGHWVQLKSFAGYGPDAIKELKTFSEDAKKLRSDSIVVVDVRGNTGGNSSWGTIWIDNLYGYHKDPVNTDSYVFTSDGNRGHFERLYNYLEKSNGVGDAQSVNHWKVLLAAFKKPNEIVKIKEPESGHSKKNKTSFKGHVYILTDYMVFSSGEQFVEQLKAMPQVTQVGIATNASTLYSDIRFDIAPSGFVFNYPTMVESESLLHRKSGQALIPEILLSLDPALEFKGQDSLKVQLEKRLDIVTSKTDSVKNETEKTSN